MLLCRRKWKENEYKKTDESSLNNYIEKITGHSGVILKLMFFMNKKDCLNKFCMKNPFIWLKHAYWMDKY